LDKEVGTRFILCVYSNDDDEVLCRHIPWLHTSADACVMWEVVDVKIYIFGE